MDFVFHKTVAAIWAPIAAVGFTAAVVATGQGEFGAMSNLAVIGVGGAQAVLGLAVIAGALSIGQLLTVIKSVLLLGLTVLSAVAALSAYQLWGALPDGAEPAYAVLHYRDLFVHGPLTTGVFRDASAAGGAALVNLLIRLTWP